MYRNRRPSRRSPSRRTLIARSHAHVVDIPVPDGGFGHAIQAYYDWCDRHLAPESWAAFAHSIERQGRPPQDNLRFYFSTIEAAALFRAAFGLDPPDKDNADDPASRSPSVASD